MQKTHGKILLVGFGPGAAEHMTLRARAAIEESDVVIGYSTYIKLVKELLDGKEVIRKGMTEEIDRCIEAWEQARQGKTVALISSGDIGVYGMAGPTYEILLQSGWTPESDIQVEIIPGATALNAAASLVGAPLTHDFCAISLSDLLTPWPRIARRLEAAARGDFVVALYNPKSGRRTKQIVEAQRILLQYRNPATPVAVVKSAYRKRQDILRVRLDEMSQCDIGMLSTVLIGNSDSYWQAGLMITPRGYHNKYQDLTGELHAGERAGRSLSLGLEGWPTALKEFLDANPEADLQSAANRFDLPLGALLTALTSRTGDSLESGYQVQSANRTQLSTLLEQYRAGGKLGITLGCHSALSTRISLDGTALQIDAGQLLLDFEESRIQLDLSKVESVWSVSNGKQEQSLHLLDRHENSLLQLSRKLAD